jgi:hypothetical protein
MTDVSGVYQWCMEITRGDAEYCADVKDVAAQVAATRAFSCVHNKTRFHLLLPSAIYVAQLIDVGGAAVLYVAKVGYAARILLDEEKKKITALLEAPNHVVMLIYEREGRLVLKKAVFAGREFLALLNGPLK